MMEHYSWFVPVWILGAPFLLMIIELIRTMSSDHRHLSRPGL